MSDHPAKGLNKTERASLTVACPTCDAKVGERCTGLIESFAHVGRYQEARRHGQTGRRGDPAYDRKVR